MRWLAGLLLLCACAARPMWMKAGATQSDADRDAYECERDSRYVSVSGNAQSFGTSRKTDEGLFDLCMQAHGWRLSSSPETAAEPTPYLPPPTRAVGPEGAYEPDAGWRPRKLE